MSSSRLRKELNINKFKLSSLVSTAASPQSVRIDVTDVNDVPGLISQDVPIVGTGAAGDQGSGLAQHWQGLPSFILMLVVLGVISLLALVLARVAVMSPSLLLSTQDLWPDVAPQSLGRAAPDDFYFLVDVLHPPSHPVSQGGCGPEYILQLPP